MSPETLLSAHKPDHPAPDHEHTRLLQAASGVVWALVFAAVALLAMDLAEWLFEPLFPSSKFGVGVLAVLAGAFSASALLPRPFGVPRFGGIGLAATRPGAISGLWGFAMGAAAASLTIVVCWAAGWVALERAAPEAHGWALDGLPPIGSALLVLILGALGEEVLFRGYGFQQMARALTPTGSTLLTGIVFGALHVGNPGSTELSVLNTALFGLLFGLAVVRLRSLWPACGMHWGWNLTLAIWGAPISGLRMRITSLAVISTASPPLSGGEYGPEASVVATLAVLALAVLIWRAPLPIDGSALIWDDTARRRLQDAAGNRSDKLGGRDESPNTIEPS